MKFNPRVSSSHRKNRKALLGAVQRPSCVDERAALIRPPIEVQHPFNAGVERRRGSDCSRDFQRQRRESCSSLSKEMGNSHRENHSRESNGSTVNVGVNPSKVLITKLRLVTKFTADEIMQSID